MSTPARVAVIVPCHDDGGFLTDAIASLEGEPGLEVKVVDDHSTDAGTLAVLDALPRGIEVVRHEVNRGLSAARNTGLAASSAPYVFPLDADDRAMPGALAEMAARLDDNPDAAVCFGDYEEFGMRERICRVPEHLDTYRLAFRNEYPVTSLFRRTALEAVGGWDDPGATAGYEDWDLWLKLAETGRRGVHAGRGVVTYRHLLRPGSMLSGSRDNHAALYGALRDRHPAVFADIRAHRRASSLGFIARRAYPVVFGARTRSRFERGLKSGLISARSRMSRSS